MIDFGDIPVSAGPLFHHLNSRFSTFQAALGRPQRTRTPLQPPRLPRPPPPDPHPRKGSLPLLARHHLRKGPHQMLGTNPPGETGGDGPSPALTRGPLALVVLGGTTGHAVTATIPLDVTVTTTTPGLDHQSTDDATMRGPPLAGHHLHLRGSGTPPNHPSTPLEADSTASSPERTLSPPR